ncbi:MMPL family transporter [Ferrimonas senticii]|uniref:MMPL family transporter n=1 Tax=Ferrimonas senticii TaxID=394566 RepID=UPI00040B2F38|nr:hypothetical protein [Ferrimonas senticii]
MPNFDNYAAKLWLLFVLAAAALLWLRFDQQGLDTDITQLLPDATSTEISKRLSANNERQLILLLQAKQPHQLQMAAEQLQQVMASSGATLTPPPQQLGQQLGQWLLPFRGGLLTVEQQRRLESSQPQLWLQNLYHALATPAATPAAALFSQDPLLLFPEFLLAQAGNERRWHTTELGLTQHWQQQHWLLLRWQLPTSPFDSDLQQRLNSALTPAIAALQTQQVKVHRAGVVFHAIKASQQAQQEMTLLGSLSLVLVLILGLLVFRHPAPLGWLLLVITSSLVVGACACWWLLGSLHAVTVVFATTLIGIAVDYTLHLCCHPSADANVASQQLRQPMLLALTSSILAYAAMLLLPFPALKQMAVFSITGLCWAFLTVQCLPNLGFRQHSPPRKLLIRCQKLISYWRPRLLRRRNAFAVVLALPLLTLVHIDDDIRKLQQLDPQLMAEQAQLGQLQALPEENRFLLLTATSPEQLLQLEEQLHAPLANAISKGQLHSYRAVSQSLPSQQRQRFNRQLLKQRYDDPALAQQLQQLGIDPAQLSRARTELKRAPLLTPEHWLAQPLLAPWHGLWLGQQQHQWRSVMLLSQVNDVEALMAIATNASGNSNEVRYLDRISELNQMMADYRFGLTLLLALAVVSATLIIGYRHRLSRMLRIVLPPTTAMLLTVMVLALLGQPLTLFTLLGLLLLFGISLDQTLFYAHNPDHSHTTVAIWLSAASTLAAFGLLSLSATPALAQFGLTLAIGLVLALLLAPMACQSSMEQSDVRE